MECLANEILIEWNRHSVSQKQRRTHKAEPIGRRQPAAVDTVEHALATASAVAPARAGLTLHVEAIPERYAHHGIREPRLPA